MIMTQATSEVLGKQNFLFSSRNPFPSPVQADQFEWYNKIPSLKLIPDALWFARKREIHRSRVLILLNCFQCFGSWKFGTKFLF